MKLMKLMRKNLWRRPGRTVLTVCGVGFALLLWVLVESMSHGLDRALSGSEAARTLIVYRQNRYCPQTSFLPEWYAEKIRNIAGVESVLPVKVFLNNCRASLDVVAFQGAPPDQLFGARTIDVISGDAEVFKKRKDGALIGRDFAQRRSLSVGDQFRFGNINVNVTGIFASSEPIEEGLVITHLDYLQRAGPVDRLGTVTQFDVKLTDASHAVEIGKQIDTLFVSAGEPTDTRAKLQFLENATRDLREILRFGRLLALACVAVVLLLVANTVVMSVQERVREFGVLRTVGFHDWHVIVLVVTEAIGLACAGAALGLGAAWIIVATTHVSIGVEGVPVSLAFDGIVAFKGFIVAVVSGALAGAAPAWLASRREIVASLRSV